MNLEHSRVRRLLIWNRIWLGLLAIGMLAWYGNYRLTSIVQEATRLRIIQMADGSLSFDSPGDGPFVITHLATINDEGQKSIASLTKPIAIIDSAGADLPKREIDKLKWMGTRGNRLLPPEPGQRITALFYKPLQTEVQKP